MRATGAFGELEQWQVDWERSYSKDKWLEQVTTFGGHSQFPPGKIEALLAGLGAAIDAIAGSFATGYTAVSITGARADPAGPLKSSVLGVRGSTPPTMKSRVRVPERNGSLRRPSSRFSTGQ
jgi:phage tail sheath gpL-like